MNEERYITLIAYDRDNLPLFGFILSFIGWMDQVKLDNILEFMHEKDGVCNVEQNLLEE